MKNKVYVYSELEVLSLKELLRIKQLKMNDLHKLRVKKGMIAANIISLQNMIANESQEE